MWIISLYTCILIITFTLSNPLSSIQEATTDYTEDFFKEMQSTLQKLLKHQEAKNSEATQKKLFGENHSRSQYLERKSKREEEQLQQTEKTPLLELYPLLGCDKYEARSRTCINVRQIGTTLTLGVQLQPDNPVHYNISWSRFYKSQEPFTDISREFKSDNLPWNINIGSGSKELRISPITETDFSYNFFEARVDASDISQQKRKQEKEADNQKPIKFYIEHIDIDMGIVYPGEELVINARAFIELPPSSVFFTWTMDDQESLPSNMKVLEDGSAVIAKELRIKKDKIITCSVFSNRRMFLAKRNFLIRNIDRINDQGPTPFRPEVNLKRRLKRAIQDNLGFEEDEYEVLNRRPSPFLSNQNENNRLNKQNGYANFQNQYFNNLKPDHLKSTNYQEESLDNIPIHHEIFYKDKNALEYLGKEFHSSQSMPYKQTVFHGSQIPRHMNDQYSRLLESQSKDLDSYLKSRNAIPAKLPVDVSPNYNRNAEDSISMKVRHDQHYPETQFPSDLNLQNNGELKNRKSGLKYRHETRDAIQADDSNDELSNNDDFPDSIGKFDRLSPEPQLSSYSNSRYSSLLQIPNKNLNYRDKYNDAMQAEVSHEELPSDIRNDIDISAVNSRIYDIKHQSLLENPDEDLKSRFKPRDTSRTEVEDEELSSNPGNEIDFSETRMRFDITYQPFLENHMDGLKSRYESSNQAEESGDDLQNVRTDVKFYAPEKAILDNRRSAEIRHPRTKTSVTNDEIHKENFVMSPLEDLYTGEELRVNDGHTFDNQESMLLADCQKDNDCNIQARCVKNAEEKRYCRCLSRYKGNGIFCWLV